MPEKNLIPNSQTFQDLSMEELISHILNLVSLVERKLYLEQHPEDKGNGFRDRNLSCGSLTFDSEYQEPERVASDLSFCRINGKDKQKKALSTWPIPYCYLQDPLRLPKDP
uniref:hypothetical protein n=1 Tax=Thermosulfidibacter takaii TaxID=412593 RepID=UPI000839980B|nr:hypothetical protein [Thermosulfidibacter takaii]